VILGRCRIGRAAEEGCESLDVADIVVAGLLAEIAHIGADRERSKQMAESQKSVGADAITALIAAILALANALDKKGGLSFEEYRDALLSMYRDMPHEDATGDPGLIFDGMLTQLERAIRNRNRQT
jgi:hypothetical protein